MPGKTMSSTWRAAPVTLSRPSLRGTGAPTMWCSCNFANATLSLDKSNRCVVTVESASNGNCHRDIVIADAYKWFCEQYSEAKSESFKCLFEPLHRSAGAEIRVRPVLADTRPRQIRNSLASKWLSRPREVVPLDRVTDDDDIVGDAPSR